ncbi:hypothetical protein F442_04155 [Phytophthora nicotianae P10297]|uniref:Uncharacterized protein n=2 Tax=Phytophthora nicotianae TaxID=4792 RepID=V9FMS2_PHYNI|nr:hypothetical protein F443_04184 [Phytophthora nicotianae P1569]ETP50567.1 hypothetical protein F442_04155 [Phytophthora nicotianae P10297]
MSDRMSDAYQSDGYDVRQILGNGGLVPTLSQGVAFEVTTDERLANDDIEGSFVERMEKRRRLRTAARASA